MSKIIPKDVWVKLHPDMARSLKIEIEPDEVVLVRFGTEFRYDYYRHAEKVLTPDFIDSLLEFDGNIVEFCLAAQ